MSVIEATSPFLNRPRRSIAEVLAERDDGAILQHLPLILDDLERHIKISGKAFWLWNPSVSITCARAGWTVQVIAHESKCFDAGTLPDALRQVTAWIAEAANNG